MTARLTLLLPFLLVACQQGPDPQQLDASAQFFLDNGGLSVLSSAGARPCLRSLPMNNVSVGGLFGTSTRLVTLIEQHKLAQVQRDQSTGNVSLTPTPTYRDNWVGQGDFKNFCFGKVVLVKAEAVPDAEPITAGEAEPYLIPGTEAHAARLTYRLEGVPGGSFVDELKATPNLLVRGSMQPDTYGKDLTVVAALPLKIEHFNVKP